MAESPESSENVQNNAETTEKKLGGCTGKGFMPGQSGNPGGRPKRPWLTEVVEEMLEEKLSDPEQRERWKNAQWEKMLKHGVVGAMFMDTAWERTEGKVAQPVRVSGELTVSLADEIRKARHRAEKVKDSE